MATTPEWGLPLPPATAGLLTAYRGELLRWNRQINLLSRRDPEGTATALIRQCAAAFALWWAASGAGLAGGALRVFDLGSGGGLPAFVWLALLAERGVAARATLVEPRQKRAWFLERLRRLPGAPAYDVVAAPWAADAAAVVGDGGEAAADTTPILFTLKALRLSETAVLAPLPAVLGAGGAAAGRAVEIVRFQPATDLDVAALAWDLGIPAAGAVVALGDVAWASEGHAFLRPGPAGPAAADVAAAGLLVSRHRVATLGGLQG
jgi:hypothetical protein